MRIMVRFTKSEQVRFVSHLDLMRAMQRAIARAGLPAAYSEGFHPHMIMSFAMALPVGAFSRAEYMDFELKEPVDPQWGLTVLNEAMGPHFQAETWCVLPDKAPSLMAVVAASDWVLISEQPASVMQQRCEALLAQTTCTVIRHGGRKDGQAVDIRPGIMGLEVTPGESGCEIRARLAAGSQGNVSPMMLAEALGDEEAIIGREALYWHDGTALVSLDKLVEARP